MYVRTYVLRNDRSNRKIYIKNRWHHNAQQLFNINELITVTEDDDHFIIMVHSYSVYQNFHCPFTNLQQSVHLSDSLSLSLLFV